MTPRTQLNSIFGEADWLKKSTFSWENYFDDNQDELPEVCHGMPQEIQIAIESKDLERLRNLWKSGISMNSCNDIGETVAHLVCGQGSLEQLAFLVTEAQVSLRVRDNTKATVLHKIAWSSQFDPAMVMIVLNASPELLWAPDWRGLIPLEYLTAKSMGAWCNLLQEKKQAIQKALTFSRWKASSQDLAANLERLHMILNTQCGNSSRGGLKLTEAGRAA